MLRKIAAAWPYAVKEAARRASLATGRTLATPTSYYVSFGGRCNLACTFCTTYPHRDPELTGEELLRLLREAKELSGSGFHVSLSGGEPLVFRPLYDALAYAQTRRIDFGFTTNGLLLTEDNARRVVDHDPFNVNVSLESVDPAINESLRPMRNGTRITLSGIERLVMAKRRASSRVAVFVKPTIMEQNYAALPGLVRHFGRNSGVQIAMQPYEGKRAAPFWVKDPERLRGVIDELKSLSRDGYPIVGDEQTLEGFFEHICHPPGEGTVRLLDLGKRNRNCDIGLRMMFIKSDGEVEFCHLLKPAIGNFRQASLSEIYYGAEAKTQRRCMVTCRIDCQRSCTRPTPLWVKAKAFMRMR